jgi:succinyl-CoA synthetase alpha subunit
VLVHGITGRQGSFWAAKMMACGTEIVAGVSPKHHGTVHLDVPVFRSAVEATQHRNCEISVIFVPPQMARDAIVDAIEARIGMIVVLTEHIPMHDMLDVFARARVANCRIVGPNTGGLVTPGEGFVGIMPGHVGSIFMPGHVGVVSRSGSLGALICLNLTRAQIGQSAFIGIGGDGIVGTSMRDALAALDRDQRTQAIVLAGEIGGAMEEEAADYIETIEKPVVAFVAGRAAPPGKKMGHAGAIHTGNSGSYASKRAALERAGAKIADTPIDIVALLSRT